jgi:FkbM family methyltransferase
VVERMTELNIGKHPIETVFGNKATMAHRIGTTDRMTIESIMKYDEYKAKEIPISEGDVFVDVGSHVGTWGIMMAMAIESQVHLYEPLPENCTIIEKSIKMNSLQDRVFCHPVAVTGETYNHVDIHYTDDSTTFGKQHKYIGNMQGGGNSIKVETISIEDIINSVGHVRVLKIDCEGCEVSGFASMSPENLSKIDYIVGEFHPWNMDTMTFWKLFEPYFDNISNFVPKEGAKTLQTFLFKNKNI